MDRFDPASFSLLVAEDNMMMQKMLVSSLKQSGYKNVFSAYDGQEAWEILQNEKVDIIISDYYMPKIDGLELLSKVRRSVDLWSIPFLMVTSEARRSKVMYSTEDEIDAYLVKPVSSESLAEYVSTAILDRYFPGPFHKALHRGKIKLRYGAKDEALEAFQEASAHNPLKSAPYYYMAQIFEEKKRFDDAIRNYRKCDDRSNSLYVRAFDGLTRIYLESKNYVDAVKVLKKAIDASPANIDRSMTLGECCLQTGDLAGAREALNTAVSVTDDEKTIEKIAKFFFDHDMLQEAEAVLSKVYDQSQRELKVFNQFGLMAKERGEFEKAKGYYFAALKVKPNSEVVNYNCAVLFISMKEYEVAKAHLNRVLLHHPEFTAGKQLLQKLDEFLTSGSDKLEVEVEKVAFEE